MPSKKRKKRQLQRRRRIERDAAIACENQVEPQRFSAKPESSNSKTRTSEESVWKTKPAARDNSSSSVGEHSLVDPVWAWVSTWVGKRDSSELCSLDSSLQKGKSTFACTNTIATILLVLLVSIVVGNRDYLSQAVGISPGSSSVSAVLLYAALLALLLLPFLLWWIVWNASPFEDTTTPSDKVHEEPNSIDDEFATILPLGLRPPSTISIGATNETEESHDESKLPPPTPKLAASKHIRTKFAEWLPFGLRYTSDLSLVFSTNVHGRNLQTLYHILERTSANHTIILLEIFAPKSSDASQLHRKTIVGMYASQRWHSSSKIYGDGRCFLFRFLLPDGRESTNNEEVLCSDCWKWSPPLVPNNHSSTSKSYRSNHDTANDNALSLWETFQRSDHSFLSLGVSASGVGAGLQLNHDLTIGESHRAVGFDNEPLCCSAKTDAFEVGLVEVYQLVREIDGLPIQ